MKFFEMIIEITIEDMYVFVIIIVRMDLSSDIKEHDYIIILKFLINIKLSSTFFLTEVLSADCWVQTMHAT